MLAENNTAVQTFAFAPYGKFVAADGDGGQVIATTADSAVITMTQDGGTPGMQYFVGPACGGTGWVVFRNDAPTGAWASLTATLNDQPNPTACPALHQAYTRYRLEKMSFPFTINGAAQTLTLPVIISEHYNTGSMASASALERSYFAQGWGLLRWEAWGTSPGLLTPPTCPDVGTFGAAPASGWQMNDCRHWAVVVPAPGTWRVADFGWP